MNNEFMAGYEAGAKAMQCSRMLREPPQYVFHPSSPHALFL